MTGRSHVSGPCSAAEEPCGPRLIGFLPLSRPPAIYLPRRYLPSHFLSRQDTTISPFRVRSFCETIAPATKLLRQVALTTLTMYMD
jgi:hypothetical protein